MGDWNIAGHFHQTIFACIYAILHEWKFKSGQCLAKCRNKYFYNEVGWVGCGWKMGGKWEENGRRYQRPS